MTDHGLSTIHPGWRLECTCGDVLFIEGAENPMPSFGAHCQGSKPLHPSADRQRHADDLKRIRIFKEK